MSNPKRGSLADFASMKPDETPEVTTPPKAVKGDPHKGLTLRLPLAVWQQLKILSVEQQTTMHALLLQAVNDLFKKHGKKPIG
jgi:hypothetical protein